MPSHPKKNFSPYCAVIVLYNPDIDFTNNSISILAALGIRSIVIDNTPSNKNKGLVNTSSSLYVSNTSNPGLPYAYNQAIEIAREYGTTQTLIFFDQDTVITSDLLSKFISEHQHISSIAGAKLGVFGGYPHSKDGIPYNIANSNENKEASVFKTDFVISSLSAVNLSTFDQVGSFDTDYFIEYVDFDFSYRCSALGFENYISRNVPFTHEIGVSQIDFFGRIISCPSPNRHYYTSRNIILFSRKNSLLLFPVRQVLKKLLTLIVVSLHKGNFMQRSCYFVRGIIDGIRQKNGKFQDGI